MNQTGFDQDRVLSLVSDLSTAQSANESLNPTLDQDGEALELHVHPNNSFFFTDGAGTVEWQLLLTIHEPGTIALTVLYSISFLVGFLGNVLSIKVLCGRRGSERLSGVRATRYLLVNLAVCDLAVVCVCMPVTLGNHVYIPWVWGHFMCRAVPFTQAVSVSASVLSLTVISVNRYLSVRCPLRSRSLFTRRRILAAITVVWVISASICIPLAITMRLDELSLQGLPLLPVCSEAWPHPRLRQAYNILLFSALYCLPVSFNLVIGFLTGRRLCGAGLGAVGGRCFSELDPRSQAVHASRLRSRRQIARMVVALVLLFAVSWLPLYLVDLWVDCKQQPPPGWLLQARPFAQWLGLTNSSLNPICYCFVGDLHRSARQLRTRYHQRILTLFGSAGLTMDPGDGTASPASALALASLPKLFSFRRRRAEEEEEDMAEGHLSSVTRGRSELSGSLTRTSAC
ncbi:neuropeptide FF receptor 1 [Denticeps clupeoides]|uniref:G-protein coupled receptors family 1 profile domain-containing protein n=1 Tax=Denticeps clupeoides TaxID=299321 RepID=A0AAY3ZTP6_9TELE|nr:neuropeptide FF receptor 1-like [Denticeps clupeoides]